MMDALYGLAYVAVQFVAFGLIAAIYRTDKPKGR